jgi:RNA polymerase-interacting CarD/CdnL/TRCF family regulator
MRRREKAKSWSRRYGANQGKLASGDPAKVAEVLADLELRERGAGLGIGEQRMLGKAQYLRRLFDVGMVASQEDRDRAVDRLMSLFAAGHLDQREYALRLARVRSARLYAELESVFIDLPAQLAGP